MNQSARILSMSLLFLLVGLPVSSQNSPKNSSQNSPNVKFIEVVPGNDRDIKAAGQLIRGKGAAVASPGSIEALKQEAWGHYMMGDRKGALQLFNKMILQAPNYANGYLGRGTCLLMLNALSDAASDIDKAIKLDPKDALACNQGGAIAMRLGEYEKAVNYFSEAIKIDKAFGTAYMNRSEAYAQLGKHQEAITDATGAIRNSQTSKHKLAEAYLQRASLLKEAGDSRDALLDLEASRLIYMYNCVTYSQMAEIFKESGYLYAAKRIMQDACDCLANEGDTKASEKMKLVVAAIKVPDTEENRAKATMWAFDFNDVKQNDEVHKYLISSMNADDAKRSAAMGVMLLTQKGRVPIVRMFADQSLAIVPGNDDGKYVLQLADIVRQVMLNSDAVQEKKYDDALSYINKAIELAVGCRVPDTFDIYGRRARLYLLKGEKDKAIQDFITQKAIADKEDSNSERAYNLGKTIEKLKLQK